MQDSLVWLFTKNGRYSVKFRYHVAKLLKMEESSSRKTSMQRASTSLWSRVWKARVPNKVKLFSWRACQNILPTRDNLVRRRVVEVASCCFYHRATETVLHVLWECGAAQDV